MSETLAPEKLYNTLYLTFELGLLRFNYETIF